MRTPLLAKLGAVAVVATTGAVVAPACSLGGGQGVVSGDLNIADCWTGHFDLKPDFFAAVPYARPNGIVSLEIRIQNGSDFETFSDGISILVDDVDAVRGLIAQAGPGNAPKLKVALAAAVTTPGVPIVPNPNPAPVHVTLYLGRSCRLQNEALFALDKVSLAGGCGEIVDGGTIDAGAGISDGAIPSQAAMCDALGLYVEGGPPEAAPPLDAGSPTDAGPPSPPSSSPGTGESWIRFSNLSNADPQANAQDRLNEGDFELYLADPREICPGGAPVGAAPPSCKGFVKGSFSFYFQRGRPAQPFP